MLAEHVIIFTNGPRPDQEKNCTVEPCFPDKASFHTHSHTDQPDRKLTFTRFYIHTHTNYTHISCTHILTLSPHAHTLSHPFKAVQIYVKTDQHP